jgi:hypothetical protein
MCKQALHQYQILVNNFDVRQSLSKPGLYELTRLRQAQTDNFSKRCTTHKQVTHVQMTIFY